MSFLSMTIKYGLLNKMVGIFDFTQLVGSSYVSLLVKATDHTVVKNS